ncbi:MAG: tetratricopeptide repeat protein [Pyrinomonadaceae bacterium]
MNTSFSRVANILFALFLVTSLSIAVRAQSDETAKLRTDAFRLIDEQKFTQALPLLEKLAVLAPDDPAVQRNLAFALLGKSKNTADANEARQFRARARIAFVRAKAAGDDSPLVSGMIESIPPDGGVEVSFGPNLKADEIMQDAEAAFTSGNLDKALELYQKALKIDPKLYHAALFSGDVYTHKNMYADAEVWYQKAISIDPNIETAYRYSATPLMKLKKHTEARDRYVEAWITEPYSKFAIQGMVQWSQITGTGLAHPEIDAPKTTVGEDGKEKTTINVNPMADDGSMAWIAYSATREIWKKEKFAKTYPTEKTYRHSLAEEADALRSVVSMARTLKTKKLNEQLAILDKLDKDGLLEAYVLMATPDKGIARDHANYLRANRPKLRQYVLKYVIAGK